MYDYTFQVANFLSYWMTTFWLYPCCIYTTLDNLCWLWSLLLLLFSLLFLLFLLLLFEGGCGRYPPFGLKNRFPVLVGVVVTTVVVVFVIDVVVVWRGLQVADGCGGSGAYAARNRLAVVGMRYGPPSPIQPLLFSYWPTSQQVTPRASLIQQMQQNTTTVLYSAGCNKRTHHGRSRLKGNSLMITVRM